MRKLAPSLLYLLLTACGGESTKPEPPAVVASVLVSPPTLDLTPGGSAQLTALPKTASGTDLTTPITWSSSTETVASVSTTGLVTAITVGSTTITATSAGVRGTATVTVAPVPVASVTIAPLSFSMEGGDTTRLRATPKAANGSDLSGRTITWSSGDPAIASVSTTGLVTGFSVGTTTVTASAEGKRGSATVTVLTPSVASIAITPSTPTLIIGTNRQLTATLRDARGQNLAGRNVVWTTFDASTVSVSAAGVINAVKVGGPVTISATSEGKVAMLAVTSTLPAAARVTVTGGTPELNEGATLQLSAVATDAGGVAMAGKVITWVSDSSAIATVDETGLVRTLRTGTVRIRARADSAEATVTIAVRGMIHRWTFDEAGGPGTTFRDDVRGRTATLVGVGARAGSAAGGQVTLTGGLPFQADYVALPSGLLRNLTDATIEVWATMHTYRSWSRVFDVGASPANNLFAAWSLGTLPQADRVAFNIGGVEHRLDNAMAPYTVDLQHHIVMAIDQGGGSAGRTRVSVYLDGVRKGEFETAYTLNNLIDTNFWLGRSHYNDETANASYDEVRIHDRVYPASDIQASFHRGPIRNVSPASLSLIPPAGIGDTIRGISSAFQMRVVGTDALGRRFPVTTARWSSANTTIATVDSTGLVRVRAGGKAEISATVGNTTLRWSADAVHVRRLRVDPFLATPASGALWEVPVVIIAYIPTANGQSIDVRKSPDFWELLPLSIDTVEQRIVDYARRVKLGREQGSRFRGYKDPLALPSIGLRITDIFVTYDIIPASTTREPRVSGNPFFPDYHKAFADLGLVSYMQARGIKEVWDAWSGLDSGLPSYNPALHDPKDFRAGAESNMSSPLTGDISNSYRHPNDLPLLNYTWTMYALPIRRTQAEALHVVGHQLEAILNHVGFRQDGNDLLFWRDFVGRTTPTTFGTGRAGWTHMPPNTTLNYGYHVTTPVDSDIEDWTPNNSGTKKPITNGTWVSLKYPWPGISTFGQWEESQWYVYWWQNFPGRGNRIAKGAGWMTNWWAFMGDWDNAIRSGLGLYGNTQAAARGSGDAYPFTASRAPAPTPWVHTRTRQGPRR